MSFKLLRIFVLLNFDKIIELGYYILKVYIYKNVSKQRGYFFRDMQVYWMVFSFESLNVVFVFYRNFFFFNVKVGNVNVLIDNYIEK